MNDEPLQDAGQLDELAQNIHDQWSRKRKPANDESKSDLNELLHSMKPMEAEDFFQQLGLFRQENVRLDIVGNPACPFLGSWQGRDEIVTASIGNLSQLDEAHRECIRWRPILKQS